MVLARRCPERTERCSQYGQTRYADPEATGWRFRRIPPGSLITQEIPFFSCEFFLHSIDPLDDLRTLLFPNSADPSGLSGGFEIAPNGNKALGSLAFEGLSPR
jgi:hypothetical protein